MSPQFNLSVAEFPCEVQGTRPSSSRFLHRASGPSQRCAERRTQNHFVMRAGCFRDSVLIQDKGDPATTFVEQREQYPKRDGILQHLQPHLFISVFGEGPLQSSTHIIDISTVDLTPIPRRLSFPVGDGLLTEPVKIGGVTSSRQVRFATISKLLQRIEADCFEKAIARRRGGGHIQMK